MSYSLTVQHNEVSDEYYIILPQSLLQELNWNEGDNIKWTTKKDGSIILTKVNGKNRKKVSRT